MGGDSATCVTENMLSFAERQANRVFWFPYRIFANPANIKGL